MLISDAEGIRYELFTMDALAETAVMTAEAFVRHEPVFTSMRISPEEFAEFVKLLFSGAEQEELTVIARNQETGQIIGAMIADDFAADPPEAFNQPSAKSGNFGPILAALGEVDTQYKQGRILTKGEFLHFYLLAVDHRQNGKKIAQHLIQACLDNGIKKGYRTGVVEATCMVSQHIFRKFGFVDRYTVPYKTFEFQGKRIFESIEGHSGIILMDKMLVQPVDA